MTKKTDPVEPEIVGTPPQEEARATREQATGSPLTEVEQDIADLQETADQAIVNRGEENLQQRDANARMEMAAEASASTADNTPKIDADDAYVKRFLKLSGFKFADLMGFNQQTKTFTTSSGGKYQLAEKGTQLRHLSGPIPPAQREG